MSTKSHLKINNYNIAEGDGEGDGGGAGTVLKYIIKLNNTT